MFAKPMFVEGYVKRTLTTKLQRQNKLIEKMNKRFEPTLC